MLVPLRWHPLTGFNVLRRDREIDRDLHRYVMNTPELREIYDAFVANTAEIIGEIIAMKITEGSLADKYLPPEEEDE